MGTEADAGMVIIGGGLAGGSAAKTLRAEGYPGPITLVAGEPHPPYLRPPLSKDYLAGTTDDAALEVNPSGWYAENGVDLLLAEPATELAPQEHMVTLGTGRRLRYDKVLLATGAAPRRPRLPGAGLEGVRFFRTVEDSRSLRAELSAENRRVVLVGSGWIAMEIAAVARGYGNAVTVVGRGAVPLSAAIGPALGRFFQSVHESHGVTFRQPAAVVEITGDAGRATGVRTDGGDTIGADLVVVAVGVTPNVLLAEQAGLDTGNGILTDSSLRASAPDVFAAGDVANPVHPFTGERLRSEHWSNALNGGKVAARSMLGQDAALELAPYFYTDQYDVSMEYSGYGPLAAGIEPVVRGSLADGSFIAFWLRDGAVVAGMNVNVPRTQKAIKELIASRRQVEERRLTDPGVPLNEV